MATATAIATAMRAGGGENYAARGATPSRWCWTSASDIGALIVHTDAGMVGVEVEISATGHDDDRSHKEVLEREINGRPAYTAVFDKIREGSYTLWVDDVARERDVIVTRWRGRGAELVRRAPGSPSLESIGDGPRRPFAGADLAGLSARLQALARS